MRAIVLDSTGGPEVLRAADLAEPVPAPGQVLVDVSSAGVTYADTLMRSGAFPAPLRLPAVLGREVVGTVTEHGEGVTQPRLGTRVVARLKSGGYAERVAVDAVRTIPVPDLIDDGSALGVLGSGITALGVVEAGRIEPGDRVLVTAAAGSIGALVVQFAVQRGARVIGLAGNAAKRELITSLGAATALDSTGDWPGWIRRVTDDHGVDVVLDSVGGPVLAAGLRLLADHGRHVLYGFAAGDLGVIDQAQLGSLLQRNLTLRGFTVQPTDNGAADQVSTLLGRLADGRLQVPITDGYPLVEAARAHRDLAERRTVGKVVLTVRAS
jgi:NADPH2:quinone reductase